MLSARSVREALELLAGDDIVPDVVVTDIGMPGEDGYAFLRRLRAMDGPLSSVPAIAVTAYAGKAEESKALRAGFRLFRAKPLPPDAALAAIVEAIRQPV